MSNYAKPMPVIDVWSRPFWEACSEERLIAQRCDESGEVWFPPSPVSPVTRTDKWTWVDLSGRGKIWSFVVFHQRYFTGFADDIPYNVAQIRLEEGPYFLANIVNCANDELEIDMPVRVVFERATAELTIPKFAPDR